MPDGSVLTGSVNLRKWSETFDYRAYDLSAPQAGIIKRIYYKDDPENLSGFIEADVVCLIQKSWVPIPNAKFMMRRGAYENFEYNFAQPGEFNIKNEKIVDDTLKDRSEGMTPPEDLNGEWIIVDFIDKNPRNAWIRSESIPHAFQNNEFTNWSAIKDIKGFQHNGLKFHIDKDGGCNITTLPCLNPKIKDKQGKPVNIDILNEDGFGLKIASTNARNGDISLSIRVLHKNGAESQLNINEDKIEILDTQEGLKCLLDRTNKKIELDTNNDAKIVMDKAAKKIDITGEAINLGDETLEKIVKSKKLTDTINSKIVQVFNDNQPIGNLGYPIQKPVPQMQNLTESEVASSKHQVE